MPIRRLAKLRRCAQRLRPKSWSPSSRHSTTGTSPGPSHPHHDLPLLLRHRLDGKPRVLDEDHPGEDLLAADRLKRYGLREPSAGLDLDGDPGVVPGLRESRPDDRARADDRLLRPGVVEERLVPLLNVVGKRVLPSPERTTPGKASSINRRFRRCNSCSLSCDPDLASSFCRSGLGARATRSCASPARSVGR